jgi:hypothetical protein
MMWHNHPWWGLFFFTHQVLIWPCVIKVDGENMSKEHILDYLRVVQEIEPESGIPAEWFDKSGNNFKLSDEIYLESLLWTYRNGLSDGKYLKGVLVCNALVILETNMRKMAPQLAGKYQKAAKFREMNQVQAIDRALDYLFKQIQEGKFDQFDANGEVVLDDKGEPNVRNMTAKIYQRLKWSIKSEIGNHLERVSNAEISMAVAKKSGEETTLLENKLKLAKEAMEDKEEQGETSDKRYRKLKKTVKYTEKLLNALKKGAAVAEHLIQEYRFAVTDSAEQYQENEYKKAIRYCFKRLELVERQISAWFNKGLPRKEIASRAQCSIPTIYEIRRAASRKMSACLESKGF